MIAGHLVAMLRDAAVLATVAGFVSSRRQSEIGGGARRAFEPAGVVEGRCDGKRRLWGHPGSGHEQTSRRTDFRGGERAAIKVLDPVEKRDSGVRQGDDHLLRARWR
jgi:hypothetical protein